MAAEAHREASVDFNAGDNSLLSEDVHKLHAVCTALVQGLFEHDGPADVLPQSWRSIQQLAPVPAICLCVVGTYHTAISKSRCAFRQVWDDNGQ